MKRMGECMKEIGTCKRYKNDGECHSTLVHRRSPTYFTFSAACIALLIEIKGAMADGMDMAEQASATAIVMKENTNSTNGMAEVSINGTMVECTMEVSVKTSVMVRVSLHGLMGRYMMVPLPTDNAKDMVNIHLRTEVNTKEVGRMVAMMDLGHARGKMDVVIKENGGMVWPMGME